jgi:hypothetical protein
MKEIALKCNHPDLAPKCNGLQMQCIALCEHAEMVEVRVTPENLKDTDKIIYLNKASEQKETGKGRIRW